MQGTGDTKPQAKCGKARFALWLTLALCVFLIDQWTKQVIVSRFYYGEFLRITDFFNLCYLKNTGAAFSFLSDAGGWQGPVFIALALAVSFALLYWIYKECDRAKTAFPLALVVAGAIGNALDRIFRGAVVDFLDFHIGAVHWPAFNVADIAICSGAALLLFFELMRRPR